MVDPKTVPVSYLPLRAMQYSALTWCVQFTVGASAKKKRENASYKSSKGSTPPFCFAFAMRCPILTEVMLLAGNVFQVDRYKVRTSLRVSNLPTRSL